MSWDTFYGNFKKAVGTAVDKINQTTDIATLQVKLTMEERKLEDAFAVLGHAAYQHFSQDASAVDGITEAMKGVEAQQLEVNKLKARIEKLKQEGAKKEETAKETPQEDTQPRSEQKEEDTQA